MLKTKVLTICGTRPELIRLSEIIKKLDKHTDHVFVHTNQNYDYELNQVFLDELKIRKPDYSLAVKADTVGEQIGNILAQTEKVMLKEKPDAILILGDTNSSLSCIVAKRLKVPIFHMEAGNRCFDDRVPEEINRRIVDHTSDVNLCYTEHARRNLLREGLNIQNVYVVGSPLPEVYSVNKDSIDNSNILQELELEPEKYFLTSIHREENVNNEKRLCLIMMSLQTVSHKYGLPIIFSTHPRTQKRIRELEFGNDGRILFHKPFGMFDFIKLQRNAFCSLSDSGTIHEDAAIFGIPVVNVRESNERPEAYDCGNVIMSSGASVNNMIECIDLVRSHIGIKFDNPYGDEHCSDRVIKLIVGLHKIVRKKEYGES
jgi:UDP-N-acetylglucosamine 2-epimerase (non-hydrolysing)